MKNVVSSQLISENVNSTAPEITWETLLNFAKRDDYRVLAEALLMQAIGTDMHEPASSITSDWFDGLKQRYTAVSVRTTIVNFFGSLQPQLRFLFSLNPYKRRFIISLLSDETTLYVLLNHNSDDICVITDDPSTSNIYKYSELYSSTLSSGVDFFEFLVYGNGEVDDKNYSIKITKEDWNAIIKRA